MAGDARLPGAVEVTGDAAPPLGNWNPAKDGRRARTGELDPDAGVGDADAPGCAGASLSLLLVGGVAVCGVTGVGGSLRSTDSLRRAADDCVGASTDRRGGGDDGLGGPVMSTDGRRTPPSLSLPPPPPFNGSCDVDADARRLIPNAATAPSLSNSLLLALSFGTTRTPPRGSIGLGLVGLAPPGRIWRDTEMERVGVLGRGGASLLPVRLSLLPNMVTLWSPPPTPARPLSLPPTRPYSSGLGGTECA